MIIRLHGHRIGLGESGSEFFWGWGFVFFTLTSIVLLIVLIVYQELFF